MSCTYKINEKFISSFASSELCCSLLVWVNFLYSSIVCLLIEDGEDSSLLNSARIFFPRSMRQTLMIHSQVGWENKSEKSANTAWVSVRNFCWSWRWICSAGKVKYAPLDETPTHSINEKTSSQATDFRFRLEEEKPKISCNLSCITLIHFSRGLAEGVEISIQLSTWRKSENLARFLHIQDDDDDDSD